MHGSNVIGDVGEYEEERGQGAEGGDGKKFHRRNSKILVMDRCSWWGAQMMLSLRWILILCFPDSKEKQREGTIFRQAADPASPTIYGHEKCLMNHDFAFSEHLEVVTKNRFGFNWGHEQGCRGPERT